MTEQATIEPCPCPWCHRDTLVGKASLNRGEVFWVACHDHRCGGRGPDLPTRKQAIAAWNRVAAQQWRPIETAPRDGQEIDVWIVPPISAGKRAPTTASEQPFGHRVPSVRPAYAGAWQDPTGRTVTGRWFYDDQGRKFFDPDDTSVLAVRATHWRPVGSGPE